MSGDPRRSGRALCRGERRTGALAELLQSPVMTTVDGKSAFPEDHALALGSGGNGFTGHGAHFLYTRADLILAIGTGLNRHPLTTPPLPTACGSSTRRTTRAICTRAMTPRWPCWAMPS